MTAEGNNLTGANYLHGYVDAVETLDERVDVSRTTSVHHDEMPYGTPPTSPSYTDSQHEKAQSSQFLIATLNSDADNAKK